MRVKGEVISVGLGDSLKFEEINVMESGRMSCLRRCRKLWFFLILCIRRFDFFLIIAFYYVFFFV